MDVKLVCIVVEGDQQSLSMVRSNIQRRVPVIIINNSGRVANILAYAFNNADQSNSSQGTNEQTRFAHLDYLLFINDCL